MKNILSQPYPFEQEITQRVKAVLAAGLLVAFFLYVLRPFNIDAEKVEYQDLYIIGYGLVTLVVSGFFFLVLPAVLPDFFSEEKWTTGKNILFGLAQLFCIGLANLYYTNLVTGMEISAQTFLKFQFFTLVITFLLVVTVTSVKYYFNLRFYKKQTEVINSLAGTDKHETAQNAALPKSYGCFVITSENEKEKVEVTEETLLYVESADNYSKIFFLGKDKVESRMIRASLKRVEEQLMAPVFYRCHRSYIVNLVLIESVKGNSQGHRLCLKHTDVTIPVARRSGSELTEKLKVYGNRA